MGSLEEAKPRLRGRRSVVSLPDGKQKSEGGEVDNVEAKPKARISNLLLPRGTINQGVDSPSQWGSPTETNKQELPPAPPQKMDERTFRDRVALKHRSLFLFSANNRLRRLVFDLTHHRVFEGIVIALIFANCIFLALDDPTLPADQQPEYLTSMELVFTIAFALEMCLKVFAQGFVVHQGSYLRNSWNVLDFLIVALSFLAFLPFFGNYSAIRMLRVLRPLRSINGIQGLKNIVNALLYSVRKLVNVLALSAFLFFIFGIIGVQLWAGAFRYRCQQCGTVDDPNTTCVGERLDVYYERVDYVENASACLCHEELHPTLFVDDGRFCKQGAAEYKVIGNFWGRGCDVGYSCVDTSENPNYGFTSFDNIGYAFLAIFQCITMEGWTDIMYIVMDVSGTLGVFYFVMLVILGSFFVLNLALAVINEQFNNIRAETEKEKLEKLRWLEQALLLAEQQLTQTNFAMGDELLVRDGPHDIWLTGVIVATGHFGPPLVRTGDGIERTWMFYRAIEEDSEDDGIEPGKIFSSDDDCEEHVSHGTSDNSNDLVAYDRLPSSELRLALFDKNAVHTSEFGGDAEVASARSQSRKQTPEITELPTSLSQSDPPLLRIGSLSGGAGQQKRVVASNASSPSGDDGTPPPPPPPPVDGATLSCALAHYEHDDRKLSPLSHSRSRRTSSNESGGNAAANPRAAHSASFSRKNRKSGPLKSSGLSLKTATHTASLTSKISLGPETKLRPARSFAQQQRARSKLLSAPRLSLSNFDARSVVSLKPGAVPSDLLVHSPKGSMTLRQSLAQQPDSEAVPKQQQPPANRGAFLNAWFTFRWYCYAVVSMQYFQPFIIGCIMFNTGMLAAEHHNQPQTMTDINDVANVVLTQIFTLEMVLKLMASGFRGYTSDAFNVLDGCVVIMSQVEFALSGSSSVSVFRALRLLRVFKLLKNFPGLRQLIGVCLGAIRDTGYLNSIILLYIFIAALVGMQFFGGSFAFPDRDEPVPRATFNSFYWSFLSVFQILTRDDWVVIMWDAMISTGTASALYFLTLVLCGDFLILNLFLAILIQSFDTSMGMTVEEEEKADEVCPPEGGLPDRNARHRASVLSNPAVRRASALFTLVTNNNNSNNPENSANLNGNGNNGCASSSRASGTQVPRSGSSFGNVHLTGLEATLARQLTARDLKRVLTSVTFAHKNARQSMEPSPVHPFKRVTIGSSITHPETRPFEGFDGLFSFARPRRRDSVAFCPECGETYEVTLPYDDIEGGEDAATLHVAVCHLVQLRHLRQAKIREIFFLVRELAKRQHVQYVKLTKNESETILGMFWEVGLLLEISMEEWVELSVMDIAKVIEDQQKLLNFRVGEEIVGQSLIHFVTANKPKVWKTNGGNSLCIFSETNILRAATCRVVKDPMFETFILACIIFSSLLMAVENPRFEMVGFAGSFLQGCNYFFTSVFVLEMVMKVITFGLLFGNMQPDPPYLRDWWNVMDGSIVVVSVLSVVLASSNLSFLKVFRTFRALRPLRVISRNRGLRMVVITLMQSIGGIGNVAIISFLIFLVFGILGVQLLSGTLHHCSDTSITYRDACHGYYVADNGLLMQRSWENKSSQHFDNIFASLLTLFEISTLELWSTIMYNCIDSVSVDEAPRRDSRPLIGMFFVVFVVVGAFFVLNLFVGVVIHNYNEVKVREDGLHYLSGKQKLWIETQRLMLNFKPMVKMTVPKHPYRLAVYNAVQSSVFEMVIGSCILLNVLVMSFEHHNMPPSFQSFVETGNLLFTFVFLGEMTTKITAYGFSYFSDAWNRFDFFLVLLSMLDLFLFFFQSTGLPVDASILRVFRIFRIMRILRLVKAAKDVRILLETVWYSLPSIANIGAFLGLLFFIYAILGVNLFALVRHGEYVSEHANFENFPSAILLLFRIVTGENWNGLMHDTMVKEPDCGRVNYPGGDDCGLSAAAPLYYISFLLMAGFVLTNLFVAIILDNFATTMEIEKSELRLHDLHKFIEIWADFDPAAKLTIRTLVLPKFLERLGPPLGISRRTSRVEILKRTRSYCIPEHGGVVHFIETIIPLARHVMNTDWEQCTGHRDLRDQEEGWRLAFPDINDLPVLRVRQRRVTADQYFASTYIAAAYRRRRAMEEVATMKRAHCVDLCKFYLFQ
eukprot:gene22930-35140_t